MKLDKAIWLFSLVIIAVLLSVNVLAQDESLSHYYPQIQYDPLVANSNVTWSLLILGNNTNNLGNVTLFTNNTGSDVYETDQSLSSVVNADLLIPVNDTYITGACTNDTDAFDGNDLTFSSCGASQSLFFNFSMPAGDYEQLNLTIVLNRSSDTSIAVLDTGSGYSPLAGWRTNITVASQYDEVRKITLAIPTTWDDSSPANTVNMIITATSSPMYVYEVFLEGTDIKYTNVSFVVENSNTDPNAKICGTFLYNDTQPVQASYTGCYLHPEVGVTYLNIKNELTKQEISEAFTVDFIGLSSQNKSIEGSGFVSGLLPDEYRIVYSNSDYATRDYFVNIGSNGTGNITLYALDTTNATEIKYIVKDENFNELENVTLQALRFYTENNAYEVIEMDKSGFDGSGVLNLERDGGIYRFRVLYNSQTLFNSIGTTMNSVHVANGLNFQVNTIGNTLEDIEGLLGSEGDVSFNTAANSFTFTFTDSGNNFDQACLEVTKVNNVGQKTVNSSCSTSDSGSIVIFIDNTTQAQYTAQGVITQDTTNLIADSATFTTDVDDLIGSIGNLALLMSTFIVGVMALAFAYNPKTVILAGSLGFAIPIFAGFTLFTTGTALLLFIGGVITTYVIKLGEE